MYPSIPTHPKQRQPSSGWPGSITWRNRKFPTGFIDDPIGGRIAEPSSKRSRIEEYSTYSTKRLASDYTPLDPKFKSPLPYKGGPRMGRDQDLRAMDPPSNTLIVRNLASGSDPKIVERQFEMFGLVEQFDELIRRRGVAFITYYDRSAAQTAFRKMQGSKIDGSVINIQFELPLSLISGDPNSNLVTDETSGKLTTFSRTPLAVIAGEKSLQASNPSNQPIGDRRWKPRPDQIQANQSTVEDRLKEAQKLQQLFSTLQCDGSSTMHNLNFLVTSKSQSDSKLSSLAEGAQGLYPSLDVVQSHSPASFVDTDLTHLLQRIKPCLLSNLSHEKPSISSPSPVAQKTSSEGELASSSQSTITLPMLESLHQALNTACATSLTKPDLDSMVAYQWINSFSAVGSHNTEPLSTIPSGSNFDGVAWPQFPVSAVTTRPISIPQWTSGGDHSSTFSLPSVSEAVSGPVNQDVLSNPQKVLY
ncbi:hypothetical protein F5890DRAFT_1557566 [Lentinula detonsa]|uniref:RRM domain-containing protein n=1 Tax=Lentinula detonsa TaxID=2804962 RepID=A0AA38PSQ7_9AGAR|nr:hypothetical protein F5890DRAFT_1557566 [Lentinula detonsa]